ncbi:MAG: GNAT family N-acetyltransferase, partial [Dehalococcoidia bacterium]
MAAQVRQAQAADIPAVKAILDAHRYIELGFVPLPAVRTALERGWLYVAVVDGVIAGTIDWWARRDGVVVLYNIAVSATARGRGAGRALLQTLIDWATARGASEIRLKCPAELPANAFYKAAGFRLTGVDAGKRRPL